MPLDAAALATLSRLLDEALALAPDELEPWLAALPPEHDALRPPLEDMLARHRAQPDDGFLSDGPRLDAIDPSAPRAGERVGPYVLIRELGQGGMGTVWLAARADGALRRQVALKLPRLAWGAGLARRMARERDILARLEHPSIARLYDAGVDGQGRPYLALEFIDGQPIDAWCEARALPLRERLALVVQVAHAVGVAHGMLVVHRDLKPSNILVTPDGAAHLLDFGIAKLLEATDASEGDVTQTQARLLTPRYASPEQAEGRPITVASDVYSLGVVLHQLLTGRLPALPSPHEDPAPASRCVTDRSVARTLRGDLDAIVGKALRHDPARRYETMQAFAADLESHLAGRPVQARPDGALYIAGRFARRHWFGLSAVTAVCAAIIAGGATAIVQAKHAAREAERARAATEFVAELFRLNAAGGDTAAGPAAPTQFIDRGASLIQARFAGQPEMQAELLGAVGRAYDDMGANALAIDYAKRRLQVLQKMPDTLRLQVETLLLASDAHLHDEDDDAAEADARRALEAATSQPDLRIEALAALARAQIDAGRLGPARDNVQRGEVLMQSVVGGDAPAGATHLLAAKALLAGSEGRMDAARQLVEDATARALRTEGPGCRTAADLLFANAMTLIAIARFDEARSSFERAMIVIRQRGGSLSRVREAVSTAAFWAMAHQKGRHFDETFPKVKGSHDALQALGSSVPPEMLARVDFEVGCMYAEWTDVQRAVEWMEPSTRILEHAKLSLRSRSTLLGMNAYLARLLGRDEQALQLVREILRMKELTTGNDSVTAAWGHFQLADEYLWQGHLDRAEQVLSGTPKLSEYSARDQYMAREFAHLRARLALARGDVAGAASRMPPMDESMTTERIHLRTTYGRLMCEGTDPRRGLEIEREAVREQFALGYFVYDPDIALARSHAGICALRTGQRSLALECAREARRAFEEEPSIGPRYREPLQRLERALHLPATPTRRDSTARQGPVSAEGTC